MKRIRNYWTLLLLALASSAVGQDLYFQPEYTIGVRGGATASWVSFSPSVSQKTMYGFQGGALFRYVSDYHFGVQVEANYTQRGWIEDYDAYTYTRQLNYVEIPFLSHIYFGKRYFRWFFNLGPSISYLLQDNAQSTMTADQETLRQTSDITNRIDYAIVIGTGFEFQTKRAGIYQLEARYSFGLGDMFPSAATDEYRRSSNQNVSLCLGILFNVAKH